MIKKILNRKESRWKSLAVTCLTFLMFAMLSTGVMATSDTSGEANRVPDLDPGVTGTLTVNLTYVKDADGSQETGILAGANLLAYQVADLTVSGGSTDYQWLEPYGSIEAVKAISLAGMTASDSDTAANAIKEYVVANNVSGAATATSNSEGKAVFSGLTPGIYMVYRNDADTLATQEKQTINPFLVMVPGISTKEGVNTWNYDVEAFPKVGIPRPDDGGLVDLGSVTIQKEVLDANGNTTTFNDKQFYAAVFTKSDSGDYTLVKSTQLQQNGSATISDLEVGTYYLFETNKDGSLINTSSFGFEITGNGQIVQIGSGDEVNVKLTNKEKEHSSQTETDSTNGSSGGSSSRSSNSVKTGDETPIAMYVSLLAAALIAVTAVLVIRRKRER